MTDVIMVFSDFRDRHWAFVKEYVIKRSTFGLATGCVVPYLDHNANNEIVFQYQVVPPSSHTYPTIWVRSSKS